MGCSTDAARPAGGLRRGLRRSRCGPAAPTVSPLNIHAWRDFPLRERLTTALGLPVAVDNDAKALALGEGWLGAARGVDDYLAMVVSTGVGGGIVLDGRLLDGHDGNAGHIGHVVVEPEGRACVCGGRGCLEAEASGPPSPPITGRPAAEAPPTVRSRTGHAGRTGRGVGGGVARPAAGGGGRFGGARVRRASSSMRPSARSMRAAVSSSPGRLASSPPAWGGRAAARCRGRRPSRFWPAPPHERRWSPMTARSTRRDRAGASMRTGRGRPCAPGPICGGRRWRRCVGSPPPAGGDGRPWLPLPAAELWRFRMVTAYGDPDARPPPSDAVDYLEWCRDGGGGSPGRTSSGRRTAETTGRRAETANFAEHGATGSKCGGPVAP